MAVKYLIAAAVAAALLVGAVGAVGAAPPDHAQPANDTDADTPDAPDVAGGPDAGQAGPGDAPAVGDGAVSVGPSDGLPAQTPEFVGEIHETVESFLDGTVDDLGKTLQGLLGDGTE